MPTKKAIIQAVIENDTYDKFISLKEKTGRSQSNLARYMIEQYIQQYEKEHGVIELSENTTQGGVIESILKNVLKIIPTPKQAGTINGQIVRKRLWRLGCPLRG